MVAVSLEDRWIDIKKTQKTVDLHATAVFSHKSFPIQEQQESLLRLGEYVSGPGIEGDGPYQAARDLLLRRGPPVSAEMLQDSVDPEALALGLGPGVLPIQGPPGAGKTFTGARMICRLVEAGRTVGVTANSHKVIRHLVDEVLKAAKAMKIPVRCLQKPDEPQDDLPGLVFARTNAAVFAAIGSTCDVAGGTPWLWSREEAFEAVDVLVVDEAGQMSLANVLAVAPSAQTVILIGDPQQLDQPLQGAHPEGTEVSALRHLLGAAGHNYPHDQGLFLPETWRLHPEICRFTSELFYGGRLHSRSGLDRQEVRGAGVLSGAGLRFLSVPHSGNQNFAPEEADAIAQLLHGLVGHASWINDAGAETVIGWDDVLVIAPFNAQVFELQARFPQAKVGTVDKFQGQQAPLVVYSMTTSSQADAPRGLEFLYSLNRLNVATSRARAVCLVVASPELLAPECRTPRQMHLVNALCRYAELAKHV